MKIEKNIDIDEAKKKKPYKHQDLFDKMVFGDSVFFPNKFDGINFAQRFVIWLNRTEKFPKTIKIDTKNFHGEKIKITRRVQYVHGRSMDGGYRVWLLNGRKLMMKKLGKNILSILAKKKPPF